MIIYPSIWSDDALRGDRKHNGTSLKTWSCEQSDIAFVLCPGIGIMKSNTISIPITPNKFKSEIRRLNELTMDKPIVPEAPYYLSIEFTSSLICCTLLEDDGIAVIDSIQISVAALTSCFSTYSSSSATTIKRVSSISFTRSLWYNCSTISNFSSCFGSAVM